MSEKTNRNLLINNWGKIPAARLHGNYLEEVVYVESPGSEAKIIGKLERISIRRDEELGQNLDMYEVKIVVGGAKLKLKGSQDIYLADGGELDLP
jgi:hypothetical protein